MIRRKKFLSICIILIITFFVSTNYLFTVLINTESEVKTVQEKIYLQLENLPHYYKVRKKHESSVVDTFIKNLQKETSETNVTKIWSIANSWVSKTKLVDLGSPVIGSLLLALKTSPVINADLDPRGTQLKLLLTLEGHQTVIFKPKWYDKSTVIEGPVYAGKDRHSSEILAFYLSAILNMPLTPCSVERNLSLSHEVIPVATRRLINTSYKIGNRTCVYGNCFYCKKEDPICEDENLLSYGTVIFNVKNASFKSHRSPWQRTYKKNKKAIWEEETDYCKSVKEKLTKQRLLDLIDISIFDFLIQNGDRHHYETLSNTVVLIDNGKGFGNPYITHLDILAPLYQCCTIRSTTLKKLLNLAGGYLREKLEAMPNIRNLITEAHLESIEKRLLFIFATIEYCKNRDIR